LPWGGRGRPVAFTFTAGKKGNPYFLQTTASNFFTTPLINRNVPDYTQFTLIARIAVDPNVIIVKSNSPFKNMKDLIAYAKAHPKEVKYGGTDIGAMDHLAMAQISKKTGVQFNYVAFTAGSEVTTNVLGGRLDVVTLGVVDASPHIAAGTLRPLGLVAESRLPMWKDTPTLREQGIDVTLTVPRGMVMPGGIPADATAFIKTMLKKATSTPEWDDYMSKNGMAHGWLEGDAFVAMGKEFIETMRPLLKDAGLLK
jgi:putative tricarboxylic transport membrane protein